MRTYEQAVDYLYGRINFERAAAGSYSARDFKLERMRRLLELLGDPHERLAVAHVAGTKGKGSTSAMLAEILEAAGYCVGLFTSPHLSAFEERMTVDGAPPDAETVVELVERVAGPVALLDRMPGGMGPTFFEIATALGWLYFAQRGAQIAVLEVGLGGRLDATNVCRPETTVITSISRDHTALLGSTLAEIAAEKAGIVKRGVPTVSGVIEDEPRNVIIETCAAHSSPLYELGRELLYVDRRTDGVPLCGRSPADRTAAVDIATPWREWQGIPVTLAGEHQAANAALALGAAGVLKTRGWNIPDEAVFAGMANVCWPLRIEVMSQRPTVVVDSAHNGASMAALLKTLPALGPARRRILVFAASRDKDVAGLLSQVLPAFDTVILTQFQNNPRAMPLTELLRLSSSIASLPVHAAADPAAAWKLATRLARPDDLICVTGSFFLAAQAREMIVDEQGAPLSKAVSPKGR